MLKARIHITLKNGVLDPQGTAILGALSGLGFDNIDTVRQGKVIDMNVNYTDKTQASEYLTQMCEKLLANTVIENYTISFLE